MQNPSFVMQNHQFYGSVPRRGSARDLEKADTTISQNCKIIGLSSIEHHHFSGAILHYLCTFNRKFKTKLAYLYCNSQYAACLPRLFPRARTSLTSRTSRTSRTSSSDHIDKLVAAAPSSGRSADREVSKSWGAENCSSTARCGITLFLVPSADAPEVSVDYTSPNSLSLQPYLLRGI